MEDKKERTKDERRNFISLETVSVYLFSSNRIIRTPTVLVLAAALAYLAMTRWLENFAYRVEISWPLFLMAGLAALGIALATVSVQTIRAALADPVKALRYE